MVLIKDESDNDAMVVFNQSQNYTLDEFCQIECLKDNFAILSLNMRSLLDKLDELQVLLSDIETATNLLLMLSPYRKPGLMIALKIS